MTIFWLRFWILYYFIVSYAKILRFCKIIIWWVIIGGDSMFCLVSDWAESSLASCETKRNQISLSSQTQRNRIYMYVFMFVIIFLSFYIYNKPIIVHSTYLGSLAGSCWRLPGSGVGDNPCRGHRPACHQDINQRLVGIFIFLSSMEFKFCDFRSRISITMYILFYKLHL